MAIFQKILSLANSFYNGKIEVIKSLSWGTYIQVSGLTQSGGVVKTIWNTTLRKVKRRGLSFRNCLILGLGGGTAACLVNNFWPDSKIIGVDIDPLIVKLGEKYLGLDRKKVQVKIADAFDFVFNNSQKSKKYDLIVVDLYCGFEFPKKFSSEVFLNNLTSIVSKDGLVLFNRLYTSDVKIRKSALEFGKKLERFFSDVEYFYPQANLIFICSKPSIRR